MPNDLKTKSTINLQISVDCFIDRCDNQDMKQCFGYIRVSGKDQISGDGPIRQEQAIREYASAHEYDVVEIFFEKGVCGEIETMERPAFIEMMTRLLSNGVRTVIVEKLDRLSRHLITQETCIQDFLKNGFMLLSADPAEFDLMAADPSRVLVRQIFGAIAQYDKAMLVAKLTAARKRQKAAVGRCEGQKPYTDTPAGQDALKRIIALRQSGMGFDKIAVHLNAENVPTKREGSRWYGSTVNKMLSQAA